LRTAGQPRAANGADEPQARRFRRFRAARRSAIPVDAPGRRFDRRGDRPVCYRRDPLSGPSGCARIFAQRQIVGAVADLMHSHISRRLGAADAWSVLGVKAKPAAAGAARP